jgi:hypothetical protein
MSVGGRTFICTLAQLLVSGRLLDDIQDCICQLQTILNFSTRPSQNFVKQSTAGF